MCPDIGPAITQALTVLLWLCRKWQQKYSNVLCSYSAENASKKALSGMCKQLPPPPKTKSEQEEKTLQL